ncbi:hypothetical protein pb186bvf_019302 [Paramecium bursaria]
MQKPKSWELRKKDPKKYQYFDQIDQILVKKPGDVDGEQFVMRNLIRCKVYILDYSATIYIDDCEDCQIFLGPVESSAFIRGCKRCKFVICCGQFRSKNCEKVDILLMCQSQPIIELSVMMGFGCFRGYYPQLAEQIPKAKINPWNNTWSDIFDFNPEKRPDVKHFYNLFEDLQFTDMMPPISKVLNFPPEDELLWEKQVVPLTAENRVKKFREECLIIFYPQDSARLNINSLISAFQPLQNDNQQLFFDDQQDDDIIDAPDVLYCYLVKSKNQPLYAENYDLFKQISLELLPFQQATKLNEQIIDGVRLQNIFSLHIRTDNEDVGLISYLSSLFEQRLNIKLRSQCIVQDQKKIQELSSILFANMKDERGGKQ